MTRIAFHLPEPLTTLRESQTFVVNSLSRPLQKFDYDEAACHPKDAKRFFNASLMGVPYFIRHAKRSKKAQDARGTAINTALAAGCIPLLLLSLASGNLLGCSIAVVRAFLPTRHRSELATRENTVAVAVYEYSMIVGSFADLKQYHDFERKEPLTADELLAVYAQSERVVKLLQNYVSQAPDRVRYSGLLPRKIKVLKDRQKGLMKRIKRELRTTTTMLFSHP